MSNISPSASNLAQSPSNSTAPYIDVDQNGIFPNINHDDNDPRAVFRRRYVLALLSLHSATATAAGTMTFSVLVDVKTKFFGDNGTAVEVQSILDAVSAAFMLFILPVLGALSDSWGRRPFLLFLGFASIVPYLLLLLFPNNILYTMISTAIVYALTGNRSGAPVITACIADVYPAEDRGYAISLLIAMTCVGLGAAPVALATGLSLYDVYLTALVLMCVSGAAVVGIGETLPVEHRVVFRSERLVENMEPLRKLTQERSLRALAVIVFCAALPEFGLIEMILFYLNDRVGFEDTDNALLMMEFGIVAILASSVIFKLLEYKTNDRGIVRIGLIANLLHLIGYAVAWNKVFVYLVPVPCAAFSFITYPAATAYLSKGRSPKEQGAIMGVASTVKGLTMVFGPLLMGLLYSRCKGAPVYLPQLPMIVGCGFVVGAIVCAFTLLPEVPTTSDSDNSNANPPDAAKRVFPTPIVELSVIS
eukprot:PhF_6_TR32397/c0_g1_i1/m.48067